MAKGNKCHEFRKPTFLYITIFISSTYEILEESNFSTGQTVNTSEERVVQPAVSSPLSTVGSPQSAVVAHLPSSIASRTSHLDPFNCH